MHIFNKLHSVFCPALLILGLIGCGQSQNSEGPIPQNPWGLPEPQINSHDGKSVRLKDLGFRDLSLSFADQIEFRISDSAAREVTLHIQTACSDSTNIALNHSTVLPLRARMSFFEFFSSVTIASTGFNGTAFCKIQFLAVRADGSTHQFDLPAAQYRWAEPLQLIDVRYPEKSGEDLGSYLAFDLSDIRQVTLLAQSDRTTHLQLACANGFSTSLHRKDGGSLAAFFADTKSSDRIHSANCHVFGLSGTGGITEVSRPFLLRKPVELPNFEFQFSQNLISPNRNGPGKKRKPTNPPLKTPTIRSGPLGNVVFYNGNANPVFVKLRRGVIPEIQTDLLIRQSGNQILTQDVPTILEWKWIKKPHASKSDSSGAISFQIWPGETAILDVHYILKKYRCLGGHLPLGALLTLSESKEFSLYEVIAADRFLAGDTAAPSIARGQLLNAFHVSIGPLHPGFGSINTAKTILPVCK